MTTTITQIQVQITHINGMGNTNTTGACFDSMTAMAKTLEGYVDRIISIEFTKPAWETRTIG